MTLEMSPEQIQESKIYREWGLTDEESVSYTHLTLPTILRV